MKPMTRYISLLLIGGLMLPLHRNNTCIPGMHVAMRVHLSKDLPCKQSNICRQSENGFSFFKDVITHVLPELKILR